MKQFIRQQRVFTLYALLVCAQFILHCKGIEDEVSDFVSSGDSEIILIENLPFKVPLTDKNRQFIRNILQRSSTSRPGESLRIEYPEDGSIFPPEIVTPTFTWDNPGQQATMWIIEFSIADSGRIVVVRPSRGPPELIIDQDAVPKSGKLPESPPPTREAWLPSEELWEFIKKQTKEKFCTVRITGLTEERGIRVLRSGFVSFKTSADSVGAPIFYRDVPFMPILNDEQGVILPLDNFNMKYIKWRMRDISRRESKVVLKNMPTCANCHTFSRDGRWLGMDIDGTQGDKGAYGIQEISKNMVYQRENIVSWNYDFKEKKSIKPTFGFLSSMSPDGRYVVSTVEEELFVVGYIDQAFLQVFYPTRGILAYYSKEQDRVKSLPGANDWDYVHCSPTWTPDGKEIIFSRAKAKDPFTKNQKMPAKANDPEETKIQYDLYRMPFNNGKGGKAEPVRGASFNGKSNNFAKVSPDGKWIVWVQCRNGLLMRPDSKLWIVPTQGGEPRLMKCNTWRMNSWHSWSPNSRWLVFSSKKNTIYTQMFLTHIDENGMDSPPVLIPNSTADNRAVNIPEFMNSGYESLDSIDVPAISHFRYRIKAKEYIRDGFRDKAIQILKRGLQEEKRDRLMRAEMMAMIGEVSENPTQSIKMLQDAIAVDPDYSASWFMLGSEFKKIGREREAIKALKKSIQLAPDNFLAMVQLVKVHLVSQDPKIHNLDKALEYALTANEVTYFQKAYVLQNLARVYSETGQMQDAIRTAELGIQRAEEKKNWPRAEKIKNELRGYRKGMNFLSFITR